MVNPTRINSVRRRVEFLDDTAEPFALGAEVVYEDRDTNRAVVNVTGKGRLIGVGDKEFFLSPCQHRRHIARSDDERTWPRPEDGVVFLVPFAVMDEIAERRQDFREALPGAGIVVIEF